MKHRIAFEVARTPTPLGWLVAGVALATFVFVFIVIL